MDVIVGAMVIAAGFENVEITPKNQGRECIREWLPGSPASAYVVSANIRSKRISMIKARKENTMNK